MAETDKDATAEAPEKPSLVKKLLLPAVLVVVAVGGTVAGLKFSGLLGAPAAAPAPDAADVEPSDAPDKDAGSPAFFYTLYPDMLVNFTADGQPRYLKVSIDVMSRDEDAIKGVEEYHAIVRNNLLSLFQKIEFDTVSGEDGMQAMREAALKEVKSVLNKYHGNNDVEGVYFTSFVVQ